MALSETEVQAQVKLAVDILRKLRSAAEQDANSVLVKIDALDQVLEGSFRGAMATAMNAVRAGYSSAMLARDPLLTACFRNYAKHVLNVDPFRNAVSDIIGIHVYDKMIATGDRVLSRGLTIGQPSASGSPVGTGTLYVLTKDRKNFLLQATHIETKTIEVVQDQASGATKSKELLAVNGQSAGLDAMELLGSGVEVNITSFEASQSKLNNASFSSYSGSIAAPTAITDWTPGTSIANFEIDTTNYFIPAGPGDTAPASVVIKANDTLSQKLSLRGTQLQRFVPCYLLVFYKRDVGGEAFTGTLRIRMGAATTTVALAAQVGWNILALPLDDKLWYDNFYENDLDILIGVESYSAGKLRVDNVCFGEMVFVDGLWYFIVSGATPWKVGDKYTQATTLSGAEGLIQLELFRSFGIHLPHADPAVNFVDPA